MAAKAEIVLSAVDKTSAAFASARRNLSGLGTEAASVTNYIKGLGAVLGAGLATAWARGIINGVDALNDLKDATGASIENLSRLEDLAVRTGTSMDTAGSAVLKLNKVLGDATPGSQQEMALKAIGLSAKELRDLDPVAALTELAVALSKYDDNGKKAIYTQEFMGKSLREVAPLLQDLAEQGLGVATVTTQQAEEAEKFNKQLASLGKNATDAGRALLGNFLPAMNEILAAFNKGGLGAGINALGNKLFDWQGSQQRKLIKNIESDIASLRDESNAITFDIFGKKGEIATEIEAKTRQLNIAQKAYAATLGVGDAAPMSIVPTLLGRPSAPDIPDAAKATAAGSAAAKAAQKEIDEQRKLLAELSGVTGTYIEDLTRLQAVRARGNITEAQYIQLVTELIAKQPGAKKQIEEAAAAQKELNDTRQKATDLTNKHLDAMIAEAETMVARNAQARIELEELGLSADALDTLRLARLDSNLAREQEALLVAQNIDGNEAEIQQIERRIRLLQEEREIAGTAARKRVDVTARDDAKKESEQFAADLQGDVRNALANAFRDTKNPIKAFGDALGNVIFTRVTESLADAMATDLLQSLGVGGQKKGSSPNWFQTLLGAGVSAFGGSAQASFSQTAVGGSGFGTGVAYGNSDLGAFFHSGGVAGGKPTFTRAVDPAVFVGAPKYHGGGMAGVASLKSDEVPAILQRGEGIFTRDQMKALGGAASTTVQGDTFNLTFNGGVSRAEVVAGMQQARQAAVSDVVDGQRRRRF